MNPESVFSLCGLIAMAGWVLLIFVPRPRWSTMVVGAIPLVLASMYAALLALHWGERTGGFSTLATVAQLFSNRWLLLAGWIHYLSFDLFIGIWEVRDSTERKVPHLLVVPCLILTFLFGPIGLLCYFLLRSIWERLGPRSEDVA